jgi:hypothetical protein
MRALSHTLVKGEILHLEHFFRSRYWVVEQKKAYLTIRTVINRAKKDSTKIAVRAIFATTIPET